MTREEMNRLNLTPIEDLITEDFGEIGTPSRNEFEACVDALSWAKNSKRNAARQV